MEEMLDYMPREDREFLRSIEINHVRIKVHASEEISVVTQYNSTVSELEKLRQTHKRSNVCDQSNAALGAK